MGLGLIRNKPFLLLIILVSGCAALDFADNRPGEDLQGRYIQNVPFFRQSGDDCGPAALASVLAYFGKGIDMPEIKTAVYTPKLKGSLPMDMELYARSTGLGVESMKGSLDTLRSYIDRGNPVICLIDLGFWVYRRPHYVTVVGYDRVQEVVFMHDGAAPNRAASYGSFEKAWQRAGRWMLVISK